LGSSQRPNDRADPRNVDDAAQLGALVQPLQRSSGSPIRRADGVDPGRRLTASGRKTLRSSSGRSIWSTDENPLPSIGARRFPWSRLHNPYPRGREKRSGDSEQESTHRLRFRRRPVFSAGWISFFGLRTRTERPIRRQLQVRLRPVPRLSPDIDAAPEGEGRRKSPWSGMG
jgi:hypothetical protein